MSSNEESRALELCFRQMWLMHVEDLRQQLEHHNKLFGRTYPNKIGKEGAPRE
jgi:hypothetical protein